MPFYDVHWVCFDGIRTHQQPQKSDNRVHESLPDVSCSPDVTPGFAFGATMTTLVISCGNTLRGDDQLGWRVAEIVEKAGPAGVEVRRVHQLTPELAESLSSADRTVIVDASQERRSSFRRVKARAGAALTHYLTAETLAGLAERLYGTSPEVYLLTVPGDSFGLSEGMSTPAARRAERAARRLITFLETSHA
jgi:hydrogenase maturation protease